MMLYRQIHKSSLNIIKLDIDGEKFTINLTRELMIRESNLTESIRTQPLSYAFLVTLHRRAIAKFDRAERDEQRIMGKLFKKVKTDTQSKYYRDNHKFPSDDLAQQLVMANEEANEATQKKIAAKEDMLVLGGLVKAFEQKADLLQTTSANYRKERNI